MKTSSQRRLLMAVFPFVTTVLSPGLLHAAPSSVKFGGWVMTDSNPGEKNNGTCVAVTAGYYGREVMDLIVRLDKNGSRPSDIILRPRSKSSTVKAFKAAGPGGKTAVFQRLASSSFGQTVFWYIPQNTEEMLAYFKSIGQFTAFASGAAGSLPFSMNGSTGALNALMNDCAGSSAMLRTASFESAFIPANISSANGLTTSSDNASAARDVIPSAVVAFRNVNKVKAELDELEAKYASINAEKRSLDSTLASLMSRLSSLTSQKLEAENIISTANAEIVSYNQKIATKQIELISAQTAAAAAVEAIKPYVPEHDRLLQIVNQSQRSLEADTANLQEVDRKINSGRNTIRSLENESRELNWDIQNTREQIRNTEILADQADRDYQLFDVEYETRDRLRNDFQLRNIENDLGRMRSDSDRLQEQIRQNQRSYDSLQIAYNQCMASAGGNRIDVIVNDATGNRRPPRRERPQDGQNPNDPNSNGDAGIENPPSPIPAPPVPPPPPQFDCTPIQTSLQLAADQLRQSQADLSNTQNSLRRLQDQRQRIIADIQDRVLEEKARLRDRADQQRRVVYDLKYKLNQDTSRWDEINNYELPQARNSLSQNESLRPGALSKVQSSQNKLDVATGNYNSYKISVNYDSLNATVQRTAATVSEIQMTLADHARQVRNRQNLIVEKTNFRNNLISQIASTNASISSTQERLQAVEESLLPYNSDKAVVVDKLNEKKSILRNLSDKFATLMGI